MNFKEGDIVTDKKCKEVFVFKNDVDVWAIEQEPLRFRFATDHEKKQLQESGKEVIKVV